MAKHEPVVELHGRVSWSLVDGECFTQADLERWVGGRRVACEEVRMFASVGEAIAWARSAAGHVEVGLAGDGRRFWAGDGPPPAGMTVLDEAPLGLVELVMRQWGRHRARHRLPELDEIRARYEQMVPPWRRGGVRWELHAHLHLSVVAPTEVEQVELLELADELGFKDPVIDSLVLSSEAALDIERALRRELPESLRVVQVDCRTWEVELFLDPEDADEAVAAARALLPDRTFVVVPLPSLSNLGARFGYDQPPEVPVVW